MMISPTVRLWDEMPYAGGTSAPRPLPIAGLFAINDPRT